MEDSGCRVEEVVQHVARGGGGKKKRDVYKGGGVRWMSIKIASNARWLGELRRRE